METIGENIRAVRKAIEDARARRKTGRDEAVELVAVTKNHGVEAMREAIDAGVAVIGENRVQEAAQKKTTLERDVTWHLIGHLQKNKVRPALELFSTFHSVDSIPLLERIQRVAEEIGARPSLLLEVNMSGERSKDGTKIYKYFFCILRKTPDD